MNKDRISPDLCTHSIKAENIAKITPHTINIVANRLSTIPRKPHENSCNLLRKRRQNGKQNRTDLQWLLLRYYPF